MAFKPPRAPIKPIDVRETWPMPALRAIWKARTNRCLVAYLPGTDLYLSLGRDTLVAAVIRHDIPEDEANSDGWKVGEIVPDENGQPVGMIHENDIEYEETAEEIIQVPKMVAKRDEKGDEVRHEKTGELILEEKLVDQVRVYQTGAQHKRKLDDSWGVK